MDQRNISYELSYSVQRQLEKDITLVFGKLQNLEDEAKKTQTLVESMISGKYFVIFSKHSDWVSHVVERAGLQIMYQRPVEEYFSEPFADREL
jgi:hypothetical protein